MSFFQSTDKAAWIRTDQGTVEAVFFTHPAEAGKIQITQVPRATVGRYIYNVHAPLPTLLHDQTIDAAYPLHFTVQRGMFVVTSSAELDKTLKRILSGP